MSKNKYNKCKRCEHYCNNGTCQLKKCSTNNPYVNIFDRWFCSYSKKRVIREALKKTLKEMEETKGGISN